MDKLRRVNLRSILANPDLRRELMVPTLQATQAREGIETTREQAERAYYVVTEGEHVAFFDLKRFRSSRGVLDRRHEMFVHALENAGDKVRFDVARRDFGSIEGAPLAYRRLAYIAHIFKELPSLEPAYSVVKQGMATSADEQFVRYHWEVLERSIGLGRRWVPYAKGGEFSRFYSDIGLVILWENDGAAIKKFTQDKWGSISKRIYSQRWFFRKGLTWPLRTQRGFNLRVLPAGCVFGHMGPSIFPKTEQDIYYLLGIGNSSMAEYILGSLTSFGSWEVGAIKKLPIPNPLFSQRTRVSKPAESLFDAKDEWNKGNEVCGHFEFPWLLRSDAHSIAARLDRIAEFEASEEALIQRLYAELNDEVYKLYGIPDSTRAIIEETVGERPPEVLWPQMEGQSAEQKRMEHVYRLLSYAVKRVVEADEDGVIPFVSMAGEPSLLERVLDELHSSFPDRDIGQLETEIVNELNKSVKGFRRTRSLAEWLENAFFEYHSALYKSRPIFWHIASSQGTARFAFGALIHYHKFNRARMAKLRSQYLREAIDTFRREAALADKEGRADDRAEWQSRLEEAQELDRRLQKVQEGEGGFDIQTPWKTPAERPLGWDPDLDDGVKVNIEPLQKAGVLRIPKVI